MKYLLFEWPTLSGIDSCRTRTIRCRLWPGCSLNCKQGGCEVAEIIELPADLVRFELPPAVQRRLQHLLDRQDGGGILTPEERAEAEGLVELAEFLSLLRLRATPSPRRSA